MKTGWSIDTFAANHTNLPIALQETSHIFLRRREWLAVEKASRAEIKPLSRTLPS
jgi:hypothetical protein